MDIVKLWRLKYIKHGLEESRKRFRLILKTEPYSTPVAASLSELIFWIGVSDEWHYRNTKRRVYKKKEKKQMQVDNTWMV